MVPSFLQTNLWGLGGDLVGTWWGLGKMAAELYYSLDEAQTGAGDGVTPFYITGYTARGSRDRLNKLSRPASPNATLCTKCLRFHHNPGNQCLHVKCNPPNRPRSNSLPSRRPRPQNEDGPEVAREREAQAAAKDHRRAQEMRASHPGPSLVVPTRPRPSGRDKRRC